MNLFRSEEHVRNWSLYDTESADGIMPLAAHVDDVLNVVLHSKKREEPSKLVPTEAT